MKIACGEPSGAGKLPRHSHGARLIPAISRRHDFLLVHPPVPGGESNLDAVAAWHRAHPGITVVMRGSEWSGVAAVDRSLLRDGQIEDALTLPLLHSLGPVAPIAFPGTPALRTALLDRDGTINVDRHYLADPEGVALLPGALKGLAALQAAGIRLAVISNQSGVGAGRIRPEALARVNQRLLDILGRGGVRLDGIYCCLHQAGAGCSCRKPLPELAHRAARELGLDLTRAIVAGDKAADVGLARALGVPAFLATTGHGTATLKAGAVAADYVVDGLDELARICTHPAGLVQPAAPAHP